jgi:hypothetical protein
MKDEGGPLEIGVQAQVSNRFKLLRGSAVVVSVGAKAQGKNLEQVRIRKTNESEPTEDASLRS